MVQLFFWIIYITQICNSFVVFLFLLNSLQSKWLPLHTLAASGEFHLMDALLKHNVDINAVDVVGGIALC